MDRGKMPLRSEVPKRVSSRVEYKCDTHLHLPVRHVVCAILHAAEDAIEFPWQHMCIYPDICQGRSKGECSCKYPGY